MRDFAVDAAWRGSLDGSGVQPWPRRLRLVGGVVALSLFVMPLASCSSDGGSDGAVDQGALPAALLELDHIAQDYLKKTGVAGMAIAVVKDDEVVYAKGFGVREIGHDAQVDADTVFQLASLSKPIGATVIAGVVGDGKVQWTDPITKHLPAFALSDPSVTAKVTIEDMYAHRSGLPGGAGDILEILGFDRTQILDRLRYLPVHGYRSAFAYSNFGLTTGGEAVAKRSGLAWEDLTRARLFQPLGMTSTSSSYADFEGKPNRATIHRKADGAWKPSPFPRNPDAQSPAGGITSSVTDLAKWMRMMLASGMYEGRQVIDAAALLDMTRGRIEDTPRSATAAASFYGLGIYTTVDPAGRVRLSHSGIFDAGASTTCVLVPSEKLGIVVLTNGEPVGLPEAVAAAFLDSALAGHPTADWLAHYHDLYAAKPPPPLTDDRPTPPAPTRADSAYVGTYGNDYYGSAEVSASSRGLVIEMGPRKMRFPLAPWDGDTFVIEHVLEFTMAGEKSLARFSAGADGKASSVKIDLLNADGLGTFTRK
jgi:CubicO group peptidase (beta-lactamase class C family)